MAGMGGLVMGRILQEGAAVAAAARRILLQPQGNLPELRAFLYENGYCVQDEAIVLDNGRYYQLILAAKGIIINPQGFNLIIPKEKIQGLRQRFGE